MPTATTSSSRCTRPSFECGKSKKASVVVLVRLMLKGKPFELSHAIVSAMTRGQDDFVENLTRDVWHLE